MKRVALVLRPSVRSRLSSGFRSSSTKCFSVAHQRSADIVSGTTQAWQYGRYLLFALLCFAQASVYAAPGPQPASTSDAALKAVAMEGLIIAASYAAAERPRSFGVGTALVMPYAAAMDRQSSVSTRWLGTIIAEGISVYNYRAGDKDNPVERDEIVRKNLIGWNIFALTVGLSEHFTNKKPGRLNYSLYLQPKKEGQTLQIAYRF